MAVDSKFFNIPFATSGDRTTIPDAVQPSGAISFTQGFGPDYERDPATDPLAKRVPRDETNEYLYQISNALKYLQLYGTPQYTAVADGGPANYPLSARVRYDAGAGMQAWRSLVDTNTAVPGSDATKWTVEDAFSEASLAETLAGALASKVITPRRLAPAIQSGLFTYAVPGGTANALTLSLTPTLTTLAAGVSVVALVSTLNTGTATLNVDGTGAKPIVNLFGAALAGGELIGPVEFIYDGMKWWAGITQPALSANRTYYVNAATGNDSNNGLASGTAFATIQKAVNVAAIVNRNGFTINILVADGTYPAFNIVSPPTGATANPLTITGNTASPGNVIVQSPGISVGASGWRIEGFAPQSTVPAGHSLSVSGASFILGTMLWNLNNGGGTSNGGAHIAAGAGASVFVTGTQIITGGATVAHMYSADGGTIRSGSPVPSLTINAVVSFTSFVTAINGSISLTYSSITNPGNVASGQKFLIGLNGVINTNGAGANYFPGPTAGTVSGGGQYG